MPDRAVRLLKMGDHLRNPGREHRSGFSISALRSSAQLAAAILPLWTRRLGPQWDLQHSSQEPIRFAEIDIGQR
jgi:hypothetical protein